MKKYLIITVATLLIALFGLLKLWAITLKDRNRMAENQEALMAEIQSYKLADSSNALAIGTLHLKLSEIRNSSNAQMEEMKASLKKMNIRLRDLRSFSSASTSTVTHVNTILRDSTIHDTTSIKYLSVRTRWNDVDITVYPESKDSISFKVITYDKMEQVLWKEPRGIQFWKRAFWRKRPIRQTIRFQNPNTIITYPQSITVGK